MMVDRFTPKRSASTRWLGSLDPIGQSPLEMRAHMKPTICSVMGSPLLRFGSQLMSNGVLRVMMPDFWLGALLCSWLVVKCNRICRIWQRCWNKADLV